MLPKIGIGRATTIAQCTALSYGKYSTMRNVLNCHSDSAVHYVMYALMYCTVTPRVKMHLATATAQNNSYDKHIELKHGISEHVMKTNRVGTSLS